MIHVEFNYELVFICALYVVIACAFYAETYNVFTRLSEARRRGGAFGIAIIWPFAGATLIFTLVFALLAEIMVDVGKFIVKIYKWMIKIK